MPAQAKPKRVHGNFRAWYAKNKEKRQVYMKSYLRDYSQKNKEAHNARNRANAPKYRDKVYKQDIFRKHALTPDELENMYIAQDYKCAICTLPSNKRLCVDHDHKSGKVRGLLCHKCNVALGLLQDNVTFLLQAVKYLS